LQRRVTKVQLDRRIIYLLVFLSVIVPLAGKFALKPVALSSADRLHGLIETLEPRPGKIALLALDFGPSTRAENEPQAEVILEHLMRRRIPVAIFSLLPLSQIFLKTVPERVAQRLMKEIPGERWEYGKDWVNLGFKPGTSLFLQAFAKSDDLPTFLAKDAHGTELAHLPLFNGVRSIRDVLFLAEFTGSVGVLDSYIQFFQRTDYVPPLGHGCTSITIPEAYIFLDSGQLKGLLEGVSGAAAYSQILRDRFPERGPDNALLINTALGVSQLLIILLVIVGNVVMFFQRSHHTGIRRST
jgi:hypothetical protein